MPRATAAPTRKRRPDNDRVSSTLLLAATAIALLWANLAAGSYRSFWGQPVQIVMGGLHIDLSFASLIDEGLMAFFFFVVGLEVKAEMTTGDLTSRVRAVVPITAAALGLAIPAVIFAVVNAGGPAAHAWGVVISTDTAFLLGALALIRPRHPSRLHTFLLVLAVVDDIGALAIIAVVYTDDLHLGGLLIALIALLGIRLARRLPMGRGAVYAVSAVICWIGFHDAGIHPTLAGVAVALVLPVAEPRRNDVERVADLTRSFRQSPNARYAQQAVRGLQNSISVGDRLRQSYSPTVNFGILPLFALANAGVRVDADSLSAAATSPVFWGVVLGLVGGKLIGITGGTFLVQRFGWGRLAPGLTIDRVAGGAALSGIGFTISLLIAGIALPAGDLQDEARLGVLAASVIAFAVGAGIFFVLDRVKPPIPVGERLLRPLDPQRDHFRGRADAPLTLVEYGDFECPFCSRATGTIDEVTAHFGDELVWVWRHLPLTRPHPHAELAARAAEAAHAQGALVPYTEQLFADQDHLERDDLFALAARLGLDPERFVDDLDSDAVSDRVTEDVEDTELMDLSSTPTFFIGGRRHHGPFDTATLIAELEASRGN